MYDRCINLIMKGNLNFKINSSFQLCLLHGRWCDCNHILRTKQSLSVGSQPNQSRTDTAIYVEANKVHRYSDTEKVKVDKVVKGDDTDEGIGEMVDRDENAKDTREQSRQTKERGEFVSRDDADLRSTLGMQCLELLGHEEDVYGQPKKFDHGEEHIILSKWLFRNR